MNSLVLALQIALATATLGTRTGVEYMSLRACWTPAANVAVYEVWQAYPGATAWGTIRHGVTCTGTGPCCAEELPAPTWGLGRTSWMLVGYADDSIATTPAAWSVPLTIDERVPGRYESSSSPALSAPILKGVMP